MNLTEIRAELKLIEDKLLPLARQLDKKPFSSHYHSKSQGIPLEDALGWIDQWVRETVNEPAIAEDISRLLHSRLSLAVDVAKAKLPTISDRSKIRQEITVQHVEDKIIARLRSAISSEDRDTLRDLSLWYERIIMPLMKDVEVNWILQAL